MPITAINGEDFRVEVEGRTHGPVLMFSNSLGSNLAMWDRQVAALGGDFRIVRYDSRGHGRSAAPEGPYSIAQLGRDALAVMDALALDRVHWCGLSMGGMVGQWLLANAPDRLDRVVLANTAAVMAPPDLWNGRIRNVRANGMQVMVEPTLERWFTKDFRDREPQIMAEIGAMIAATPVEGYCGCCAAIRDMDQRDSVRAAKNPVLIVVGQHDPATLPLAGEALAHAIPGAALTSLDAAHLSNVEAAEAFSTTVRSFLKGSRPWTTTGAAPAA